MGKKDYEEVDFYNIIPQNEEVYVLHYKGKPFTLSPWDYQKCIERGAESWHMPSQTTRKVYFTEGRARAGIAQLPKILRDKVEIVKYKPERIDKQC